jgi:hypothetical protein
MAGLGDLETDWKDKISATLLLGSDAFVRQMVKRLKGDRREQLGLRQSERVGRTGKPSAQREHRVETGLGNARRGARQWSIACRLVSGS